MGYTGQYGPLYKAALRYTRAYLTIQEVKVFLLRALAVRNLAYQDVAAHL